jgi:hypothetical protein
LFILFYFSALELHTVTRNINIKELFYSNILCLYPISILLCVPCVVCFAQIEGIVLWVILFSCRVGWDFEALNGIISAAQCDEFCKDGPEEI